MLELGLKTRSWTYCQFCETNTFLSGQGSSAWVCPTQTPRAGRVVGAHTLLPCSSHTSRPFWLRILSSVPVAPPRAWLLALLSSSSGKSRPLHNSFLSRCFHSASAVLPAVHAHIFLTSFPLLKTLCLVTAESLPLSLPHHYSPSSLLSLLFLCLPSP